MVERDVSPKEENVRIGQDFALFDPNRTVTLRIPGRAIHQSKITLSGMEGVLPIRMQTWAVSVARDKGRVITPFQPEVGYQVIDEDLDADKRIAKVERLCDELQQAVPLEHASLVISVHVGEINRPDLITRTGTGDMDYEFKPEVASILKSLRLQLTFPPSPVPEDEESATDSSFMHRKLHFEAKPSASLFHIGRLSFLNLYPLETGASPVKDPEIPTEMLAEGFNLYVPDDVSKLNQIKARFVLSPEKPAQQTDTTPEPSGSSDVPEVFRKAFEE